MKRDNAREIAIQILYSGKYDALNIDDFLTQDNFDVLSDECDIYSNKLDDNSNKYIRDVVNNYNLHSEEIDNYIQKNSKSWNINRISSTALACLRCALTEIIYMDDIPPAASINSVVEIDKGYDDPDVVSFVNGLLGSVVKDLNN